MDFSLFALKNDIYLYFWIIYLKPILDYDNTYKNFIKANSSWADFSQYSSILKENMEYITYTKRLFFIKDKIIKYIDDFFKKSFLKKTIKSYNELNNPFGVIISDDLLKFHDNDVRGEVSKKILYKN
jgi:hypothetical protein